MSRIHRRLAPSYLALIAAAALTAPAFAATTTISVPAGTTQTTAIPASPAAGDTIIVDVDGTLAASPTNYSGNMITGNGAGAVEIIDDGRIQGRFTFTSATGPVTVAINSGEDLALEGWHTAGTTTFGSGADTLNNTADGTIITGQTTTFNFGAGSDVFTNAGRLIIGGVTAGTPSFESAATLTVNNLETFNNSGLILLGTKLDADDGGLVSDGETNDKLAVNGAAYTGSGDSRIALDVHLDALTKADCSTAMIADCVVFTGGSTAGSTMLTINNAGLTNLSSGLPNYNPVPGFGAFNAGITVIMGASAADDFILDPNMPGYMETDAGPVLELGLASYRLDYDSVGKRHMLVSTLPSTAAAQTVAATASSQEIWHETTGSWFTRQADLRVAPGGLQSSNGVWVRMAATSSNRDAAVTAVGSDSTRDYPIGVDQRTSQLVFGGDLLRGDGNAGSWVLGVMLGAVRGDAEHEVTGTELIYTGVTTGIYGSYLAGPLFVDAIFNANFLDAQARVAGFTANDMDELNNTIQSVGGQIEAGWRLPLDSNINLEPLVAVSYVTTQVSDMEVGSSDIHFDFDNGKSLRAGAGLRGTYDTELMGMAAAFSLTGRYWQESEGQNAARLVMPTGEASLADELPGSFSQVDAGLNLFSSDGGVSGFVNVGGKFGDEYDALSAAMGIRLRW